MKKSCIYCGNTEDLTKDHIPPKTLFPKPRPSNLITVPCCKNCNGSFSLEKDLFPHLDHNYELGVFKVKNDNFIDIGIADLCISEACIFQTKRIK